MSENQKNADGRFVHFPVNGSLGSYQFINEFGEDSSDSKDARGEIFVPRNMKLALRLGDYHSYLNVDDIMDISALSSLKPDDLYYLDCRFADLNDDDMAYIFGLTGLKGLNLDRWIFNAEGDSCKITDAGLIHIKKLASLKELDIAYATKFTDAGMINLRELTALKKLILYGTKIGDAGVKLLQNLTALEELDLHSTEITDKGLSYLQGLDSLKELNLNATKISDEGLCYLRELTSLEILNLNNKVSDAGVTNLQGLTSLKGLDLGFSLVTDSGLSYLRELSVLKKLNLDSTKITDIGLSNLRGLSSLKSLGLRNTKHLSKSNAVFRANLFQDRKEFFG